MSTNSAIEWTDATWNPVRGCTKISPGCKHCYAETFAERWRGIPGHPYEQGFDLRIVEDKLTDPLHWRKPRRVFVNSMSDLFHKDVPFEFIDRVFAVMALTPQHTYQVLTKRAERMAEYLTRHVSKNMRGYWMGEFGHLANAILGGEVEDEPEWFKVAFKAMKRHYYPDCPQPAKTMGDASLACPWPLPNVWLGTSVENQECADERIPHLCRCPAAIRFLSVEPMLGPVDIGFFGVLGPAKSKTAGGHPSSLDIDWVICGGESGPGARPMQLRWAHSLRDQCGSAGIPFFYKQGGSAHKCEHSAKGGCMECAPKALRVREFPKVSAT